MHPGPPSSPGSRDICAQDAIYLDYQASTPLDPEVFAAMEAWFLSGFGNPHSAEHAYGWRAARATEEARASIAALIHAEPEDIVFTSGATESNNCVILGAAQRAADRDTILVSAIEHSSIFAPARHLASRGFRVLEIPIDSTGQVRCDDLEELLSTRVLLVSVGAVNNEIGSIQDLQRVGECCHEVGALLHTDAAQALAACELPLGRLPVDFASLSSHKAYGPKGVGALYIAPGNSQHLEPLLHGGGQENGLRAGTLPTPLCVGFGAACEKLMHIGKQERVAVRQLRDFLCERLLRGLPDAQLNVSTSLGHPGNLNFRLNGIDARDLIQALQPVVACSTGSACHSGTEEPSHVLRAIGLPLESARASLRISIGRFTQKSELERAAKYIIDAALTLRSLAA